MSPLVQGLLVGFFAGVVICSSVVCAFIMHVANKKAQEEINDFNSEPGTPSE